MKIVKRNPIVPHRHQPLAKRAHPARNEIADTITKHENTPDVFVDRNEDLLVYNQFGGSYYQIYENVDKLLETDSNN
jgi:hypothetical protein